MCALLRARPSSDIVVYSIASCEITVRLWDHCSYGIQQCRRTRGTSWVFLQVEKFLRRSWDFTSPPHDALPTVSGVTTAGWSPPGSSGNHTGGNQTHNNSSRERQRLLTSGRRDHVGPGANNKIFQVREQSENSRQLQAGSYSPPTPPSGIAEQFAVIFDGTDELVKIRAKWGRKLDDMEGLSDTIEFGRRVWEGRVR